MVFTISEDGKELLARHYWIDQAVSRIDLELSDRSVGWEDCDKAIQQEIRDSLYQIILESWEDHS